jgi:hypothetical protein
MTLRYEVIEGFSVKTPEGTKELEKGQIIKLSEQSARQLIEAGKLQPLPHIQNDTLIIPHNSSQKYHWWNRGQDICTTLKELGASDEILKRYESPYSNN